MAKKSTKESPEMADPKTMSKEQLGEKRKEITEYYEGNIPHLETQLKYEQLLRDIEKTRAERLQAQMYIAQTMAPSPEESAPDSNESEMKKEFDQTIKLDPSAGAAGAKAAADQIKRTLKRQADGV